MLTDPCVDELKPYLSGRSAEKPFRVPRVTRFVDHGPFPLSPSTCYGKSAIFEDSFR